MRPRQTAPLAGANASFFPTAEENWLPEFAAPAREAGPAAIWLWGSELDFAAITRQLDQMAAQGIASVLIRPGRDAHPASPMPGWKERAAFALSEAARLSLSLWLPAWPAPGSKTAIAQGVGAPPRELWKAEIPLTAPADWPRAFRAASRPAGEMVALLLAHAGSGRVYDLTDGLQNAHAAPLPEESSGAWRLVAFFQRAACPDCARALPFDPMAPEATEDAVRACLTPYEALLHGPHRHALRGFFLEAPFPRGADSSAPDMSPAKTIPWTETLLAAFRQKRRYDLRPRLLELWEGAAGTEAARSDYYQVTAELLTERTLAPMRAWCAAQGVALAFLPTLDGSLAARARTLGDPFLLMGAADLTGFALPHPPQSAELPHGSGVSAAVAAAQPSAQPPPQVTNEAASLLAASAGAETGFRNRRSIAVIGPEAGWGQSLRGLKIEADARHVAGIEQVALSALSSSLLPENEAATPSLFLQNPFWPFFSRFTEYERRVAFALSQGEPGAEIGLYLPMRAAWEALPPALLSGPTALAAGRSFPELRRAQDLFTRTLLTLRENQREVALLDDRALLAAEVGDGALRSGNQTLRALALPAVPALPLEVVRALRRFVESGGLLATVGPLPTRGTAPDDEVTHSLLATLFTPGKPDLFGALIHPLGSGIVAQIPEGVGPLATLLAERLPPRLRLAQRDPAIRYAHRAGPDCDLFFLTRVPGERRGAVLITFQASGVPVRLDPETGDCTRLLPAAPGLDRHTLSVDLSTGSALIAFVRDAWVNRLPTAERVSLLRAWNLGQDWTVTLAGTLLRSDLRPWGELGAPYHSGRGEYRAILRVPERGELSCDRLILDLGDVREWAQVWLNGSRIGERGWPPYCFDITARVHPGDNDLQIIVGNTPANAMLREERVSGLLGPVTVRAFEVQR